MAQDYAARLRIPIEGSPTCTLSTLFGKAFSVGYKRVVIGGRGPYVEFERKHLVCDFQPLSFAHFYFVEWSFDGVKIYDQKHRVNYADYVPGFLYASPFVLRTADGIVAIAPPPTAQRSLF